ncbi:hypothetical protein ACOMHN_013124 [Nucella lapillus]
MEKRMQKQSEMIAELVMQGHKQREQLKKQKVHISRLDESDDVDNLEPVVNQLGTQVETLSANIHALQNWVDDTERTSATV